MQPLAQAVLGSWRFDGPLVAGLAVAGGLYARGWRKLHGESPGRFTTARLTSFVAGLFAILIAFESPLDAFAGLLLQVHMAQHLLLIMITPPLIWFGQPVAPLLRGLPGAFLRDGLGPFLSSRGLRRVGRTLGHPVFCWSSMTAAIAFWHIPRWYDLGLSAPGWHMLEHLSFLGAAMLFWFPVVGVWPAKPQWPRAALIPYLLLADLVNTALSAWLVFSGNVVYRTYEVAPRLGGISALRDQSTAGMIMWVPGSLAYLIPAFIVTMRVLSGRAPAQASRATASPLPKVPPNPARLIRIRSVARVVLLILAVAVIADGLLGPQIPPLNLAGVLPWTYWRGLTVVALIAAGNFFCMACPFMLVRDSVRRWFPGAFSVSRRWPAALRSKWLAAALMAIWLWAYDAFSLWNSPAATAWIVAGYFVTALAVDGWFGQASFCKYLCPIGQFHFVGSCVSPLEVGVRSAAVCTGCNTHDCLHGNQTHRGCEMQLFQPVKAGNFDCTFCLDCVQSCPQGNVAVVASRAFHAPRRKDVAALSLVLTFGAFLNAAAMTGPGMQAIHSMHARLGSMVAATTAFYLFGALAVMTVLLLAVRRGTKLQDLAAALLPLGFSMWAAHFLFHFAAGWQSLGPVLGRLLHIAGTFAAASSPAWVRGPQLLLLDAGLLWALYIAWKSKAHRSWSVPLACVLYAFGAWILFQPMEMRGLMPV